MMVSVMAFLGLDRRVAFRIMIPPPLNFSFILFVVTLEWL